MILEVIGYTTQVFFFLMGIVFLASIITDAIFPEQTKVRKIRKIIYVEKPKYRSYFYNIALN